MRPLLYVIYFILPAFIVGFVSGYQYLQTQNKYQEGYNIGDNEGYSRGYEQGACGIVRTVTGRLNCQIKQIQTASGKTIRAAISLPE